VPALSIQNFESLKISSLHFWLFATLLTLFLLINDMDNSGVLSTCLKYEGIIDSIERRCYND